MLKTTAGFLLLWLSVFVPDATFGNNLSITQKRGLSNNSVTGTIKDKFGFLWIATRDGLNKFDGHNVTTFYTQDRELGTITDNYFNSIGYFGGDSIFLSTEKQIYVFSIVTNQFSLLPFNSKNEYREGQISSFLQTDSKGLWIGSYEGGLYYFDFTSKKSRCVSDDKNWDATKKPINISSFLKEKNGSFWMATLGGGLIHYNPETKEVKSYSIIPALIKNDLRNSIRSLDWKNETTLYVGTWGHGLWIFDIAAETFSQIWFDGKAPEPYPYNDIRCLFADKDKTVWFGTNGGGLYHLDDSGKEIANYSVKGDDHHFIADNDIYTIFREEKGIYWIGTDGGGLQQINLEKQNFGQINTESTGWQKLSNNDVQDIFIDSHRKIWVATNGGGLTILSQDKQKSNYLTLKPNQPNSLKDNTVYTVTEDQFGRIWIGSNSGGIQVYLPEKNQFINLKKMYKGPFNFIYSLFSDSRGNMWVSSYTDNFILKKIATSLTSFQVDSVSLRKMSGSNFQAIMEDRLGNVWIGTNSKGVFCYSHATGNLTSLNDQVAGIPGPKPRNITGIVEDRWNNIWISTSGTGLFYWIRSTNQLVQITEKEGLINNNLSDLVADRKGNLWMSSPLGLGLIEVGDYQSGKGYQLNYYQFNQNDGIENEVFSRNSGICDKNGYLYFGGTSGITVFQPENIDLSSPFQPIVPTRLLVNNVPVNYYEEETGRNINSVEEITFDHHHFIISIEVTSLEFSNPDKISYAYKMEGLNNEWVYTQSQRFFTFTSLPAGDYTLKIKSTNTLGNWNEKSRDIRFHILPPLWATWWAYTLYFASGLVLIFGFIQWRSRKLREDKKLLEEVVSFRTHELHQTADELKITNNLLAVQTERLQRLDKKKTELFTNISHEFRTPLTLILNPLENLVKSDPKQPVYSMMYRNATRLNRLINQLLEIAKADSGQLAFKSKTYDFVEFIKSIVTDFASLASQKNRTVIENYPDKPLIFSFDPDHMEKIVTTLLSNSFNVTNPGDEIHINIFSGQQTMSGFPSVELVVEDSGIGIPKDQLPFLFDRFFQVESGISRTYEGSGIGLSLVRELVMMHNGTIEAFSELGGGTKMKISLPMILHSENPVETVAGNSTLFTPITNEIPDLIDTKLAEKINPAAGKTKEILKILLVEDNQDLLTYVKSLLDKYEVITSSDGENGLQTAIREVPDLIISDVMMPVMDGYTLTKELKNNQATWHIPVVLLTAKSSLENKITGLGEGADAYLTKPFQTAELIAVLENLLKSREKLRQIYRSRIEETGQTEKTVSKDDLFVQTVIGIIEENISNTKFGVEELASRVFLSRSQLNRKLSAIIDQSPNALIRTTRMKHAKILLENNAGTISEIAFQVGFDNLAYFSKCFRETFNVAPSSLG